MIEPSVVFTFDSSLQRTEGGEVIQDWVIPKDLPYFDGHFPGDPIFPAIAIIDGSLELLNRIKTTDSFSLDRLKSAKFLNVIQPGMQVRITAKSYDGLRWDVLWTNGEPPSLLAELSFTLLRLSH